MRILHDSLQHQPWLWASTGVMPASLSLCNSHTHTLHTLYNNTPSHKKWSLLFHWLSSSSFCCFIIGCMLHHVTHSDTSYIQGLPGMAYHFTNIDIRCFGSYLLSDQRSPSCSASWKALGPAYGRRVNSGAFSVHLYLMCYWVFEFAILSGNWYISKPICHPLLRQHHREGMPTTPWTSLYLSILSQELPPHTYTLHGLCAFIIQQLIWRVSTALILHCIAEDGWMTCATVM